MRSLNNKHYWVSVQVVMFLGLIFLLAGCSVFDPEEEFEERTSILWDGLSAVTIPDTVLVGENFHISILTSLNGCDKKGHSAVNHLSGHSVKIAPKDLFYIGPNACPANNFTENHQVQISFGEPGSSTVIVQARNWNVAEYDSLGYYEFPIVVLGK